MLFLFSFLCLFSVGFSGAGDGHVFQTVRMRGARVLTFVMFSNFSCFLWVRFGGCLVVRFLCVWVEDDDCANDV